MKKVKELAQRLRNYMKEHEVGKKKKTLHQHRCRPLRSEAGEFDDSEDEECDDNNDSSDCEQDGFVVDEEEVERELEQDNCAQPQLTSAVLQTACCEVSEDIDRSGAK